MQIKQAKKTTQPTRIVRFETNKLSIALESFAFFAIQPNSGTQQPALAHPA
jgi:hypothetical protein